MSVPQPLVSWYKDTNGDADQLTRWDIGKVDTASTSPISTFLVFNNRKGATDVPNMQNAKIMTKNRDGGNTGELVEGQWIEVKVENLDMQFNKIGYDLANNTEVARRIKAVGSTTFGGITSTPDVLPHTTTGGEVSILGVANDGSKTNSAGNYARVQLLCRVPGIASAGYIEFLTRVTYQYE